VIDAEDSETGILGLGWPSASDSIPTVLDTLFNQNYIDSRVFSIYLGRLSDGELYD